MFYEAAEAKVQLAETEGIVSVKAGWVSDRIAFWAGVFLVLGRKWEWKAVSSFRFQV